MTFKVTFKKQHFPLGTWVGEAILYTCAKQVDAYAPIINPKPEKLVELTPLAVNSQYLFLRIIQMNFKLIY